MYSDFDTQKTDGSGAWIGPNSSPYSQIPISGREKGTRKAAAYLIFPLNAALLSVKRVRTHNVQTGFHTERIEDSGPWRFGFKFPPYNRISISGGGEKHA
jgi:hypothetical protein